MKRREIKEGRIYVIRQSAQLDLSLRVGLCIDARKAWAYPNSHAWARKKLSKKHLTFVTVDLQLLGRTKRIPYGRNIDELQSSEIPTEVGSVANPRHIALTPQQVEAEYTDAWVDEWNRQRFEIQAAEARRDAHIKWAQTAMRERVGDVLRLSVHCLDSDPDGELVVIARLDVSFEGSRAEIDKQLEAFAQARAMLAEAGVTL